MNDVLDDDKLSPLELELQPLAVSNGMDDSESPSIEKELRIREAKDWRGRLEEYFFPPEVPRACQLYRPENIAIPACYLMVGLLQGLSSPIINTFPLDLAASEAQQTTISSIRSLPASFKLLFGFVSDNLTLGGYRRKPYMFLGWAMASISLFSLLFLSNIMGVPSRNPGCFASDELIDDGNSTLFLTTEESDAPPIATNIPDDAPSIPFLSLALLGFGTGFWMADVMGDSVVAEKAKLEPPETRGSIQSTCYSLRFFGVMVGAPLSTWIYATMGPFYVIFLLSLLPLSILPLVWMMGEERYAEVKPTRDQCHEIWQTVCSRSVWQPMAFVYIYNFMQMSNGAWREFLMTTLDFSNCQLNMILISAYVLLYLGVLAYKYWFITWSWRRVYIVTTLLNGLFSALQVLLIYGITFGLSPFLFALGDDAFAEFIAGIQFLPTTIMMVHLCPVGSEGASYAMFTTVNNSALTLSSAFSTQLLRIWDVSHEALANGRLQGLVNLTYLTTFLQVSAIVFVGMLPHFKEDLASLKERGSSTIGGTIFLTITFGSIAYAVGIGVLNIVAPGWMGES